MTSRRAALIGVILLVPIVGAVLVFQVRGDGSSVEGGQSRPERLLGWQERLVQRAAVKSATTQGAGYAPLIASHGAAERMPMATRRRIKKNLHGAGPLRLRFNHAQYVKASAGVGLWIVEGAGVTCLFREAKPFPPSACRTSVEARRQGITLETYRTSKEHPGLPIAFLAVGAVPDGVPWITVMISGSRRKVRVQNGVWAIRARTPVKVKPLLG